MAREKQPKIINLHLESNPNLSPEKCLQPKICSKISCPSNGVCIAIRFAQLCYLDKGFLPQKPNFRNSWILSLAIIQCILLGFHIHPDATVCFQVRYAPVGIYPPLQSHFHTLCWILLRFSIWNLKLGIWASHLPWSENVKEERPQTQSVPGHALPGSQLHQAPPQITLWPHACVNKQHIVLTADVTITIISPLGHRVSH